MDGSAPTRLDRPNIDPLGSAFAVVLALSLSALPLMTERPNRIASGTAPIAWSALPSGEALIL